MNAVHCVVIVACTIQNHRFHLCLSCLLSLYAMRETDAPDRPL
jgi:hypothetical protein